MRCSDLASGTALTDFLSTVGRNSSQTMELTLTSVEVVFRRMTLGGSALAYPAGADYDEFAPMAPEETQTFSDAGSILIQRSAQIGQEVTRFIAEEMTRAAEAAAPALTTADPVGIVAVQADAGMSWAARLAALPRAIYPLALKSQAAAAARVHCAATDNVERLRNRDVRP